MPDTPPMKLPLEALRRERIRARLELCGNAGLGVAAGGVPWTFLRFDGIGPVLAVGGFVAYLILIERRARV
jgi:hypothetical protein